MSEQLDPTTTNMDTTPEPVAEPAVETAEPTETTTASANPVSPETTDATPETTPVAEPPAAPAAPAATDGATTTTRGGPSEYSPPERESRNRRAGSDVRLEDLHYKNVPLLSRFIDGRGRILSRRKTRVSAKMQRQVVKSIKHARHLALLPYTADQTRVVRKRR